MGHSEAADHYTHFSYEMVALTPRCAAELGYQLSDEDKARSYIEVSGRKGFGVKADDLLDTLIASAKKEVDSRHPELSDAERLDIATQIAIGALRYFMLKYTKNSVIAFDFKEALSFEGEPGPMPSMRRCGPRIFSARAELIPIETRPLRFLPSIWLTTKYGHSGWRLRRPLTSSIRASRPQSRHTWRNMHFNWRSYSILLSPLSHPERK